VKTTQLFVCSPNGYILLKGEMTLDPEAGAVSWVLHPTGDDADRCEGQASAADGGDVLALAEYLATRLSLDWAPPQAAEEAAA
jgi:hypothetical protein